MLKNARLYSFRVADENSMKCPVPHTLIDIEILKLTVFHSSTPSSRPSSVTSTLVIYDHKLSDVRSGSLRRIGAHLVE